MDRRRFVALIGSALAAPLARAQRSAKVVRIGILAQVFPREEFLRVWAPFIAALRDRGWREGDNYSLEIKEAHGDPARALTLAKEFVAQPVDLILALSTASAVAAKQASDRIPVVTWCGYPVEAGLAASLSRPGGNVTGLANYANAEVWGKFVELLREMRPGVRELGVLWDYSPPAFPDGLVPLPAIERAAKVMKIGSRTWMVRSGENLAAALTSIEGGAVGALIISYSGGFHNQLSMADQIGAVVARRRLPAITDIGGPNVSRLNCALAYSPHTPEIVGRIAGMIDRILRGANPADLPFELPARYDLVVNAKSAKAIGLSIPSSLLIRADRVIE